VRSVRLIAQTPPFILFIAFEIAFEPFDMAVALKGQYMRGEAVEEEAVMADDHRAAGEAFQCLFKGTQRFDVEIVGWARRAATRCRLL
jgi:hypothetical protein